MANVWKPTCMIPVQVTNEKEAKTEELYKNVFSILNKVTPESLETLGSQLLSLPIDNGKKLQEVVTIIHNKAVDDPKYSETYAQMCKLLSDMHMKAEDTDNNSTEYIYFQKCLVTACQKKFEDGNPQKLHQDMQLKVIEDCQDAEERKRLKVTYEKGKRKFEMDYIGNIRFVGELFKLKILTLNIIQRVIKWLLDEGDDCSLESLCVLLTTIGKNLEMRMSLSLHFEEIKQLSVQRDKISNRVRFMLLDVIDLRCNKWIPRRENPKCFVERDLDSQRTTVIPNFLRSCRQYRGGFNVGSGRGKRLTTTPRNCYSDVNNFATAFNELHLRTASASFSPSTRSDLKINDIRQKLSQFLSPDVATFNHIYAWIAANVGEKVNEPKFISALSTAVFENAMDKENVTEWKLQENTLLKNCSLLAKYINKKDLELRCLYTLQTLLQHQKHSEEIVFQAVQILWNESVISSETFMEWEKLKTVKEFVRNCAIPLCMGNKL